MEKTKGILIVAAGSPYYGRMAYNLAISIKSVEKIPVAVLHGGAALSHLSTDQKELFDFMILDDDLVRLGSGAKLQAYSRTPFDHTLLIDADNLWMPFHQPSELFTSLAGVPFTAITEGMFNIETGENHLNHTYPTWAKVPEIIQAYNLKRGKFYQWRSEVMYFERSEAARKFFKKAKEIFAAPKVSVTQWGKGIPDEFAINVAAAILAMDPHEFYWQPSYWMYKMRNIPIMEAQKKYFVFSTGGNNAAPQVKKIYNNISAVAHRKLRKQYLFTLQSKSGSLPERAKL